MLYKDYDHKVQLQEENSGHEPQEAWRQNEVIGGKPASREVNLTLTRITMLARASSNLTDRPTVSQLEAVV
jgi:hypothetical protein